jgi:hypothetical protein
VCSRPGDAGRLERLGIDVHHLQTDEHDPAGAFVPSRKVTPHRALNLIL